MKEALRHSPLAVLFSPFFLLASVFCLLPSTWAAEARTTGTPDFWLTNGPGVYRASVRQVTNAVPAPKVYRPPPTNLPPEIRRAMMVFQAPQQAVARVEAVTNKAFDHFLPQSLNYLVWRNLLALTNGRNTIVWSLRTHPTNWPAGPPRAEWNPRGLMWGMRGLTALSPCWEGEGLSGQVPITALTRRHGYTRGHSMGPDGFGTRFAGKKVWFLTPNNQLVERRIVREIVRTAATKIGDYTIVLFDSDLPDTIQPMRVTGSENVFGLRSPRYPYCPGGPNAILKTEQTGHVSADIPGFTVDTWKGGDSGSPNMLPLPGELVFFSGRSTSGPSAAMQADMDELCRLQKLKPARYQLQWVDLSGFPAY